MEEQSLIKPDSVSSWWTPIKYKIVLLVAGIFSLMVVSALLTIAVKIRYPDPQFVTINAYAREDCNLFAQGWEGEEVTYQTHTPFLVTNANVWIGGKGVTAQKVDIYVADGRIQQIQANIAPQAGWTVVDAEGGFVTPGLIDMHSHVGVYSFPSDVHATQDGNELTNPASPMVRAIDAFTPEDSALIDIKKMGVTSMQILPGSGNVMGGQSMPAKHKGSYVEEMRIKNAPLGLKMACGENPKRVYGGRNPPVLPGSRMGNAWVMRSKLQAATELFQQQVQYCENPNADPFPRDMELDNLVYLVRNQAVLNIHCYKVVDMEMAIRVAKEFGVKISSFHHASEAYLMPSQLAHNNITVALFADNWGFKMESMQGSVHAPRLLNAAGVNVALKTDHPVINGRDLLYQSQKSAHWGLPEDAALNALTTLPAAAIGLDSRIGSLAVGKDADLVVWDRHPLHLGARPTKVFVEGIQTVARTLPIQTTKMTWTNPWGQYKMTTVPANVCQDNSASVELTDYKITNAQIYTGLGAPFNGEILVQNGNVACVAATCPASATTFDLSGGVVTPGLISTGTPLGLIEVEQENTWQDGYTAGDSSSTKYSRAIDGVSVDTLHARVTWAGGVLTSISRQDSASPIAGRSSVFTFQPNAKVLKTQFVINAVASVDVQFGNAVKGSIPSFSQQLALLRLELLAAQASAAVSDPIYQAINGTIPLVIYVNSADQILSLLRLFDELGLTQLRLILAGAGEAYLVATELATRNVSVLINRCSSDTYELRRCDNELSYRHLKAAGVPNIGYTVGTLMGDIVYSRTLRWEVGLAKEWFGIASTEEAVNTVTTNIARMFGFAYGIKVGEPANLVGFTDHNRFRPVVTGLVWFTSALHTSPIVFKVDSKNASGDFGGGERPHGRPLFKKRDQKGSLRRQYRAQMYHCIKFRPSDLVKLQPSTSRDEWISMHTIELFKAATSLFNLVDETCTAVSCPQMTAGPQYLYLWPLNPAEKPVSMVARAYMAHLFDWIQEQLDDESVFPNDGAEFSKKFLPTVKKIMSRLVRVYGHLYHHAEEFTKQEALVHLNSSFRHLYLFIAEFNLVNEKEFGPVQFIIDAIKAGKI